MRKYFENGQWAVYLQFGWAIFESCYNPFSGFWGLAIFCFVMTSIFIMDANGEFQ